MTDDDNDKHEDEPLRSVALQDARTIHLARERAEEELRRANEALELRSMELARSLAMMRATLESTTDGILVTDGDGRVTEFNRQYMDMWRLAPEDMQTREHDRLLEVCARQFDDPRGFRARIDDIFASSPPASFDLLKAADGRLVERSSRGQFVGGKNVGRVWSFRDVTERSGAARTLAEERERLRITLSSIGDAVISTDAEGRVIFANRVAEELTGWPQAEALGRSLLEVFQIVNESTRLPVDNPALRALKDGRIVGLANHTVLLAKDGVERPIDDSAAPIIDESGAAVGAVLVFRDVSERKRAEEARARLAAIVESSQDAIVSKSLEGKILSWNGGAGRLFGYTPEEAIGQPIILIIPPERLHEESGILARLRRGERVEPFETVRVTKDGSRIDISLAISPVLDHAGRVIGTSKVARDISAQKRAAEALRLSEERHRFLANLAAATQPLIGPDKVLTVTARLLAEHLGVDRCAYAEVEDEAVFVITGDHTRGVPSIVGRWPVAAFGPEAVRCMLADEVYVSDDVDSDPKAGADLEAYRRTNIQAVICVPLHKAGRLVAAMAVHQKTARRWTAAEVELVRVVAGRCWESLERARVARDYRMAADRLSLALSAASLGDWRWDAATDAVTLSARAAEIFGVPEGPVMTRAQLFDLIHEDDRDRMRERIDQAVAEKTQYDIEYRVRRADHKEVWVSAKGRAQYEAGQPTGTFGVLQDITDRKHLEQELRQRAEELAAADRKKDDFIALLAHELRNPLAPLRNGLQVMRLASADAAAVAKARTMMDRQLSHMVRLIDDLMDVSRISRNKLELRREHILLADVISSAVETARPVLEAAGHALTVSLPREPVFVDADLTRLAQVFSNLLTNSAKYTEPGGQISLSAEQREDEVVVALRDTGIGIPAEALPTIFDMFSQLDRGIERSTGGLGIGLALVRGLTEMHGGTVSAASAGPGAGSTFTVRLPAPGKPLHSPAASTEESRRAAGPRRRILVVDDNRDSAASMTMMLELRGGEIRTAYDGVEAVEVAAQFRPDVILMDVGMPRLSGLDATRQIREQPWGRAITIIALTGWGQVGDREQSRLAGCDGHLVKPVDLADLEALLAELASNT